jgi:SRSO17 transposase
MGMSGQRSKLQGWPKAISEDSFETTKNELGLDHNETLCWRGWHRHVALVMLAFAIMAVIRSRANTSPKKTRPRAQSKHHS